MNNYMFPKHTDFTLSDGFWSSRQQLLSEVTIYAVRDRFRETGRFDAMHCNWINGMPNRPHVFWDSDIAKWVESAAYLIAQGKNLDLQDDVEAVIDCIEKNMDDTGYFNSYYLSICPSERYTDRNEHELYTSGHLIEAAIAYYEATGRDRFLKLMIKNVECIERAFVTERTASFYTPGHEEIELALFKLYKVTGDRRHFELAKHFIEERGKHEDEGLNFPPFIPLSFQSHLPVREQTTAEGHSVRATYLYCGMADEAILAGDEELFNVCKTLFLNIIERRMYITGGIGSTRFGEAFTVDYDLPNLHAYTETCAAIGLSFFAKRMLIMDNNSIYSDTIERIIYNGFLSSFSLSGNEFFYENALEVTEFLRARNKAFKEDPDPLPPSRRSRVFNCSCCPPNITRMLSLINEFVYTFSDDTVFVHQYIPGCSDAVKITTEYPLNGHIELETDRFEYIAVRIPGWCDSYSIKNSNGDTMSCELKDGYAYLPKGKYIIDLDMEPTWYEADPHVCEDAGRVALMRGPVVYCLEAIDNGELLHDITVSTEDNFELDLSTSYGVPDILADGFRHDMADFNTLYRKKTDKKVSQRLRFIPYFTFANREKTDMTVWVKHA